jgi:hypothetical protein
MLNRQKLFSIEAPIVGVRLNAFSDIDWENICPWMYDIPQVIAYDYSKRWDRVPQPNYHLTFSVSDNTSNQQIVEKLEQGFNVAVVFKVLHRQNAKIQEPLPETFLGYPVIDGDKRDTRYEDAPGSVIGLRVKGKKLWEHPGRFVRPIT